MKKRIHILSSGSLERESNTIVFISQGRKQYIPIRDVSSLYAFGELSMNKRFLEFLSANNVPIHFYNFYGYYIGSFFPRKSYNSGIVTLLQAKHYLDEQKRLYLAKQFVRGSISNMRVVLNYYRNRGVDLADSVKEMSVFENEAESSTNVEALMGIEGNAREVYYQCFNKILKNSEFVYEMRTRRPPTTKINTLISFGNGLVYATVLSEIYKTHLDPRIGFLHSTNSRKFSLNLDVAELFKPLLVDRVIFSLVNKLILGDNDFSRELEGLYLTESGKRKFLQEFESRLETTVLHRTLRRRISYQGLIRIELYKIEKHLLGEVPYVPFVMRW